VRARNFSAKALAINFKFSEFSAEKLNMNNAKRGLILLVDDEPEITAVVAEKLAAEGYDSICAGSGAEALALLDTMDPDAILTDIKMPVMTGLEMVHEIRRQGIEIPCVILSAHAGGENMVTALRIGVTDFLEKPFRLDNLFQVLSRAVALGQDIKRASAELDLLCESSGISAENRQSFKRLQLARMIMRRDPTEPSRKTG
jgi:CheY-like chemotaxis protein